MKRARALLLAAAILSTPVAATAVDIAVTPEYPIQGQPARITVTEGGMPVTGAAVSATYRPNSEVTALESVGTTDIEGAVAWRPEDAGLVRLDVEAPEGTGSQAVSVRFASPPSQGLVILFVAGIILFGGNIRFVSQTLKMRD